MLVFDTFDEKINSDFVHFNKLVNNYLVDGEVLRVFNNVFWLEVVE
jgi:hypothetical protein